MIAKMMKKSRDERHQTPSDLVKDLEAIQAGDPPAGMEAPQAVPANAAPKVKGHKSTSSVPKLRRSRRGRRTGGGTCDQISRERNL